MNGFAVIGALILCATFAVRAADQETPYPHAHEPIATARQVYDGAMMPDLAVNTFRNIDRLFPTRTIKHGVKPYPLRAADKP
ncbi:MAG: serine hydrolase, partial [Thermoanaerobaculia bacterium]